MSSPPRAWSSRGGLHERGAAHVARARERRASRHARPARPHAPYQHHPLRRHRRQRHERHRRGAAESRLPGPGLGPAHQHRDAMARGARRTRQHRSRGRQHRRRRCGGRLGRGGARQPGAAGGARGAHPGGGARRDARRAHALPLFDRGRRHARQDHHHQSHRQHPLRRRRGPDLRRRAPQERRQQRAPGRRALPGRRGRRERRLVHAPAAPDRDRHQHRHRSLEHPRRGLRAPQAELRRLPAQPAVLRPGGAVRGRRAAAQHPAGSRPPDPLLRPRVGGGRAGREPAPRGVADAFRRQASRSGAARRDGESCRRAQRA